MNIQYCESKRPLPLVASCSVLRSLNARVVGGSVSFGYSTVGVTFVPHLKKMRYDDPQSSGRGMNENLNLPLLQDLSESIDGNKPAVPLTMDSVRIDSLEGETFQLTSISHS
jgi:hypothetical protein